MSESCPFGTGHIPHAENPWIGVFFVISGLAASRWETRSHALIVSSEYIDDDDEGMDRC